MPKTVAALAVLRRTSGPRGSEVLPSIRECVEFGEARDWGLRVIFDLAAGEAGIIPASDLDFLALLVSPPSHGKTYFARVLARSLNASLIELTIGSIFSNDGHLGAVIAEMRAKFQEAAEPRPSVC